jgi:hypothetical protein
MVLIVIKRRIHSLKYAPGFMQTNVLQLICYWLTSPSSIQDKSTTQLQHLNRCPLPDWVKCHVSESAKDISSGYMAALCRYKLETYMKTIWDIGNYKLRSIRHPQHTQTCSNSSTIAADSSNGVTNTRCYRYSCTCS